MSVQASIIHKRVDVNLQYQWIEWVGFDNLDHDPRVLHHGKFKDLSDTLKALLDMNAPEFKPEMNFIWVAKLDPEAVVYKKYEHVFDPNYDPEKRV